GEGTAGTDSSPAAPWRRAAWGRSMSSTAAPISSAVFMATYSGEYASKGYQTGNLGGMAGLGLATPARPSTLSSSRYEEYSAIGGRVLASTTKRTRSVHS